MAPMLACLLWAALAATPVLPGPSGLPSSPSQPEGELIALVLFDATRADHLGAWGYKRPTTPNLDRLASRGRRFVRATSTAPWTRPSTTSFLTGLSPSRHLTESDTSRLPDQIPTLAERLSAAGWYTTGFVANGHAGSLAGLQRGFANFEDPSRTYVRGNRGKVFLNGLPTGNFIAQHALASLASLDQGSHQKVFLYVFLVDAHDPYETAPALEKMFLGPFVGTFRRNPAWEFNNAYPEAERQAMISVYDAGIRAADAALGSLMAGLEQLKRFHKTTWVVSSDHGEGFGEHGVYLHGHHFFEEIIHIPLIAAGPDFAPGEDKRLTDNLDVAQTLATLGGAPQPSWPGRALHLPEPQGLSKRIISEYNNYGIHRSAIRSASGSDDIKVIWQRPANEAAFMRAIGNKALLPSVVFDHDVVQSFDLKSDPGELRPLPQNHPKALALLKELKDFVQSAPAPQPSHCEPPMPLSPIAPHGGELTLCLNPQARQWPAEAELSVDAVAEGDLGMLAVGAYSPLKGFMDAQTTASVTETLRLPSKLVWPIPITLGVDAAQQEILAGLRPGMGVRLLARESKAPLAHLKVQEVFERDAESEAKQVFGTTSLAHPGVAQLMDRGNLCLAGEVAVFAKPTFGTLSCLTPAESRAAFVAQGFERVVGFQTRNPIHRAHEYILKCAMESSDGLLLHPLVGATQESDIPADVRQRCYEALIEAVMVPSRVILSGLCAPMRYAGPKEAVLHALIRQNFGCTHFIVGRDHAGVGQYYGTYAAQKIFEQFTPEDLKITIVPFENAFFCRTCSQMATAKTCPHPESAHMSLSGTEVRRLLAQGQRPPPEFSRPQVADVLVAWAQSKSQAPRPTS